MIMVLQRLLQRIVTPAAPTTTQTAKARLKQTLRKDRKVVNSTTKKEKK